MTYKESTQLDSFLIRLYVDEYRYQIESLVPDVAQELNPDDPFYAEELRDCITDLAADYIHDHERPGHVVPEIREAAKKIANFFT